MAEPSRVEVIPWPHSHPNRRNDWWVVRWTEGRGYFPLYGPYKTKRQADARLAKMKDGPTVTCFHENNEWSGSAREDDSGWDCDECGVFVPIDGGHKPSEEKV
jgi:hypothetical protein